MVCFADAVIGPSVCEAENRLGPLIDDDPPAVLQTPLETVGPRPAWASRRGLEDA